MANIPTGAETFNGDYKFNYIKLFSYRYEQEINITGMFSHMELYESISSPFLTMKISLIDGVGLLSKVRITGDEFLEIDCVNDIGDVGLKEKQFFIYKISDREYISERGTIYMLHCISLPALADLNTKISRSFTGQPSEIVKAIAKEYLGLKDDQIYVEDTKSAVQYISNYWTPLRNMKFLSERSVSKNSNAPAYVFYETKKSFVYTSLNALKEQPATSAFFYTFQTHDPKTPEARMAIIEKMWVDTNFDYIDRVSTGAMGNRTLLINPMTKSYTNGYYDVIQSFDEYARLNEEPFSSIESPRRINTYYQTRIAPTSSYKNMNNEKSKDWFSKRVTEMASMNAQSIQIDVTGKFNIYAGNIVDLYVYSEPSGEGDNLYSALDTVFSGRWMVMSICHWIDKERHSMSLQLNKDSLFKYRKIDPKTETGTQ